MKNTSKSLSRAEKSLYITSAAAILLFAGFAILNASRNSDVPITFPTPITRPKPNGFDLYVAAAKATIRLTPEHDPTSDTNLLTPGSPAYKQRYSLARHKAWIKANGTMLALLNKAKHTPTMSPNMRSGIFNPNNNFGILRQLTRDNASLAHTYQMEGRPYTATQTALDGIQMGNDISINGNLMSRLVGIAMMAISRSVLEDFNTTINQLNAIEAKAATTRLEKIITNQPKIESTLEEERWSSLSYFQQSAKSPDWRSIGNRGLWSERLSAQLTSKQQVITNINHVFDEVIAQSKRPFSQRKRSVFTSNDLLTEWFASPAVNRIQMNEARANVGLDLLLLRLALRAYKLEHGAYPTSLIALSPQYLKIIPTDDYGDGKPYFYRLKNGSFELWSVGFDGKNDNGQPVPARVPNPNFQAADVFQEGGDFVAGKNR